MLSQILRTIHEHALLEPGQRVLVGLSGGPDSTALLHALHRLAARLGVTVEAAVVDHQLRPGSGHEAAEAAARCRALGVPCRVLPVTVARGPHVSLQDAARRARLGALEQAGAGARVALGHTADDQAETVLFRIVRGTGVAGLAGIPYRRDPFVRPLLDVRRGEVLRYLTRRRLPFIQDPSNADPRFSRARVRHQWIPFLARENPRLVEALLALAAEARRGPAAGPAIAGLSRRTAETLARLAAEGQGTRLVSVPGATLEVRYGRVAVQGPTPVAPAGARELFGPGHHRLAPDAPGIEVSFGDAPDAGAVAFDLDRVVLPLRIRPPRPGDRMRSRGGRGGRKLADLLIDAKVPRPERARLPVLEDAAGRILFVPGLRPSEVARPGPDTQRWMLVRAV